MTKEDLHRSTILFLLGVVKNYVFIMGYVALCLGCYRKCYLQGFISGCLWYLYNVALIHIHLGLKNVPAPPK